MADSMRQPINLASLSGYLSIHAPEIKQPFSTKQFGYGQSNPTYELTASDSAKYVLRKKPPGKLLSKTAHQIEREYRVLHALERTNVPVPAVYILCEDTSVIGTPFYIMEFLDGRIFEDASIPGVTADVRNEMWHDAIRTLAKLHLVEPQSISLSNFGRSFGFYDRQIKTLNNIARSQARAVDLETNIPVGKIPHFDELVAFFKDQKTQPIDRTALIHGDFKIDNLVFHKSEPRVIGILDWEMSTLGHPLSDIANLLSPYYFAQHASSSTYRSLVNPAFSVSAPSPGIPAHSQCISWYRGLAGWDPRLEMRWAVSFGILRNGVIVQGIAARYALRQASSEKANEYGGKIGAFGDLAWGLVSTKLSVQEHAKL